MTKTISTTATATAKTIELFGRLPDPTKQPSKTNKHVVYHLYSMRQAIKEGFILDVLRNYTNYEAVRKMKQKQGSANPQVDEKRASMKLRQWEKLHPSNIAQKVEVIVEHFVKNLKTALNRQAKAMIVASGRKEAVRYKHAFDK